jgi:hypothetical protein
MSSLHAEITALLDRARADGSKVVALEAVEQVLRPKHRLTIHPECGWDVEHPRACRHLGADCDIAHALRTAPILSSPHTRGRCYEVWLDPGAVALSFLDITGREGA